MPEISRFYGLVISMHWGDHLPAHFHVRCGRCKALVAIRPVALLAGDLPPRALGMATEWARLRRDELLADWDLAVARRPLRPIEPLE